MNIPLLDLKREYEPLKREILASIEQVLGSGWFYNGENVRSLEHAFAEFCGAKYGIGVSSGTDALYLALLACGVGRGDEVITVSHTFIATVATIALVGASPVFVDIDPRTYTLDVSQVKEAITERTKAIIPVHIYGHAADMEPILDAARRYDLRVIEDACQAHGAEYKGRQVGSMGDAGCFSFVFTKNLKAYGDAGIVITDSEEIARQITMLRDHGRSGKYVHPIFGLNCRLDEIQAAILRVKLPYLDEWTQGRRQNAKFYNEALAPTELILPFEASYAKHVYHQYVIRSQRRDELALYLKSKGIATGIHYPIPCHLQEACQGYGYVEGNLPVTEKVANEVLSLPVYPELEREEMEYVIESIKEFEGVTG